jgi:hypothetical protein
MVVADRKKPKINLSLLPELREAFDKSAEKFGEKRKWLASSAAIFLWLKLTDEERDALADRIYEADFKDEKRAALLSEIESPPPPKRRRFTIGRVTPGEEK